MFKGEISVRDHLHSVHVKLHIPDLDVVGDAGGGAHELALLGHAVGGTAQREAGGQRDGGIAAPVVVRQIIDHLQPRLAICHVGQAVIDGQRPGQSWGGQHRQKRRGHGWIRGIVEIHVVRAVSAWVHPHGGHAEARAIEHDLFKGVRADVLGRADARHGRWIAHVVSVIAGITGDIGMTTSDEQAAQSGDAFREKAGSSGTADELQRPIGEIVGAQLRIDQDKQHISLDA